MKSIGLNELREKYLTFFESKEHLRLPSASLVPQGDKSLLLINSGMAPLKKYFTREMMPPSLRVTTCQKCIRTPDIESVGITARHGTYFEMLGNFSFGDYFKKEATAWAWELFTKVLEMPEEKLHITVYEEDDEAYDIWTKEVGISPSRMTRLGKKDNFWEHGTGPCGPCSELHFDRGEKYGCGAPDCAPGCECDRYMEIWNLVFTQFNSDGAGNYTELAMKNIDTGMGLERLACVMQGVDNLFEVDTVQNIMKHIMKITGVKYHEDAKRDISLRVITDHIRSTTFMVGDGVMPSNEGRGYVLRRLLRRAARHGRLLGVDRAFLAEVCETVIAENEGAYPNLAEKRDFIQKVIHNEEVNFLETIDMGLRLLEQMIEETSGKTLSGEDAFRLSDTYGFPIDLTKEILAERGMQADEEAFRALVVQQRERSRNARQDAGADAWKGADSVTAGMDATLFMGYETLQTQSHVDAMIVGGEKVYCLEPDTQATIVLDQTPFYAESGGQLGDIGLLQTADSVFRVSAATKTHSGVYLHHGSIVQGEAMRAGETVDAIVDETAHQGTQRNHSAAHLLQSALRKILGNHVEQAGQQVGPEVMRFDFTHFSALTPEELAQIEENINAEIMRAQPIAVQEMPIARAKEMGAMALFGEKYGETVRVVQAGEQSTELCGGTHAGNTGELGLFRILSESSVAAGVRRITAVTGFNLLNFVRGQEALIHETAQTLKIGNAAELAKRAAAIAAELRAKDKEIERLKAELAKGQTAGMLDNAAEVKGLKLVAASVGEATVEELRTLCDSAKKGEDSVVVLAGTNAEKGTVTFICACGKQAVAAGAHAGNIVRETAKIAGGAGGGKPDSAMAGAKDISKTDEALAAVQGILEGMLS